MTEIDRRFREAVKKYSELNRGKNEMQKFLDNYPAAYLQHALEKTHVGRIQWGQFEKIMCEMLDVKRHLEHTSVRMSF